MLTAPPAPVVPSYSLSALRLWPLHPSLMPISSSTLVLTPRRMQ